MNGKGPGIFGGKPAPLHEKEHEADASSRWRENDVVQKRQVLQCVWDQVIQNMAKISVQYHRNNASKNEQ